MNQTPEQVAKAGNASFFHFHDGAWHGIALERGMEPLEFLEGGGLHDEGFSWSYATFSWDTGEALPTLHLHTNARDCDGPITHDRTLSFTGLETRSDDDFGQLKVARWDVKSSLTHDYHAIAAGYWGTTVSEQGTPLPVTLFFSCWASSCGMRMEGFEPTDEIVDRMRSVMLGELDADEEVARLVAKHNVSDLL